MIPILALVIFAIIVAAQSSRPAMIGVIRLSESEDQLSRALGARFMEKFEVNQELPIGTIVTYWVEYSSMGEKNKIVRANAILREDKDHLPITLIVAPQPKAEKDIWTLFVGDEQHGMAIPNVNTTGMGTQARGQLLEFGKPIILTLGDWSTNSDSTTLKFIGDPFSTPEAWLQNDNTFVFRIQFDLPPKR